ncbi:MAG: cell division protein FtsQ/DivIB [Comamonas sp.]|nr:cell division protein FtsQ/DivIB [Comamonas sp.]
MNVTASFLFLGVWLLVLGFALMWVLRHPTFSIARIVVDGQLTHNNAVTLRANVAPYLTGNFFTLDLGQAQQVFEQVPWVRRAEVRRAYPSGLWVRLHEHEAQAYWGQEVGASMLNTFGEIFEANHSDLEQDTLPRLFGPAGSAPQVQAMYYALHPLFEALQLDIVALVQHDHGGWWLQLDNDARVELGTGKTEEVLQRSQRFVRTLTQVLQQYRRQAKALQYADLRYPDGYALRLQGVSTLSQLGKEHIRTASDRQWRVAASSLQENNKYDPVQGRR